MAAPESRAKLERDVATPVLAPLTVGGIVASAIFARAATRGSVAGPAALLAPIFPGAGYPIPEESMRLLTTPYDMLVLAVSGLTMYLWECFSAVRPRRVPTEGSEPTLAADRSAALSAEAKS